MKEVCMFLFCYLELRNHADVFGKNRNALYATVALLDQDSRHINIRLKHCHSSDLLRLFTFYKMCDHILMYEDLEDIQSILCTAAADSSVQVLCSKEKKVK